MPRDVKSGTRLVTEDGKRRVEVREFVGAGGQAEVYATSDAELLFKRLHSPYARSRAASLRALKLPAELPISLPLHMVRDQPGYLMRRATGSSLARLLDQGLDYATSLRIAHGLMQSLATIHLHVAHGDVREENVFVELRELGDSHAVVHVTLIDSDNYARAGLPPPEYLGDQAHMAPELRLSRDPRLVSRASDMFSAALIVHKLLLLREDASHAGSLDEYRELLAAGRWLNDPLAKDAPASSADALDARMLDLRTASLLRGALQANPALRPSAESFARHLQLLLDQGRVVACPHCEWPVFLQHHLRRCPHQLCAQPLPVPVLVLPGGEQIVLTSALQLGSRLLPQPGVARRHAELRPLGPLVSVTDSGTPEMRVQVREHAGQDWMRLEALQEVLVAPHPRDCLIRLGEVELGLRLAMPT